MDFADDIAYSVHDVEDGIISGRIHLNALWDQESLESLGASGETAFGVSADRLVDAGGRLRNLQVVAAAAEFDGSLRGRRNLKAMTSELVGRYVGAIIEETIAHPNNQAGEGGDKSAEHGIGPSHARLGRIHGDLIVPDQVLTEVTLLKSLAVLYVMNTPERKERQRPDVSTVVGAGGRRGGPGAGGDRPDCLHDGIPAGPGGAGGAGRGRHGRGVSGGGVWVPLGQ